MCSPCRRKRPSCICRTPYRRCCRRRWYYPPCSGWSRLPSPRRTFQPCGIGPAPCRSRDLRPCIRPPGNWRSACIGCRRCRPYCSQSSRRHPRHCKPHSIRKTHCCPHTDSSGPFLSSRRHNCRSLHRSERSCMHSMSQRRRCCSTRRPRSFQTHTVPTQSNCFRSRACRSCPEPPRRRCSSRYRCSRSHP